MAMFAASPFIGGVAATAAATGTGAWATGSLLSAVGGGSLLSNLSTGFSIFSTIAGGMQQSADYKAQAKAEKFNAQTREIDRKKNLIRALALQNVRQGAGGITGGPGSSAQAIQLADIRDKETDTAIDAYGTGMRVNQLKQNAKSATMFSLLSAAGEGLRYRQRVQRRGSI